MNNVTWHKVNDMNIGIWSMAMTPMSKKLNLNRIVGYNGILKGDEVIYSGNDYTVVMVSRLGDFGLSETGELPYTIRVRPDEVVRKDAVPC